MDLFFALFDRQVFGVELGMRQVIEVGDAHAVWTMEGVADADEIGVSYLEEEAGSRVWAGVVFFR